MSTTPRLPEPMELRMGGEGTLHSSRWFQCVVRATDNEANLFLQAHREFGLLTVANGERILARLTDEGITKKFAAVTPCGHFGIVDPRSPLSLAVLASRTGAFEPLGLSIGMPTKGSRLATLADFDSFRVSPEGYCSDPTFLAPEGTEVTLATKLVAGKRAACHTDQVYSRLLRG